MLDPFGQSPDHAGESTQPLVTRILVRPLVEQLEPHADPEERHPSRDGLPGHRIQPRGSKGGRTGAKGAHPGQHHAVSRRSLIGIGHQFGVRPQVLERLLS